MIKPFIKWAGGKTRILHKIPFSDNECYIEPFLGGGSVLIHVLKKFKYEKVIANDINETLINTYKKVKNDVEGLILELENLTKDEIDEPKYYEYRRSYNNPKDKLYHSEALFIILNKTCYRGLFRVSAISGDFNTSFDTVNKEKIYDVENLRGLSKLFENVEFYNMDYVELLKQFANDKCLIYMDPPYFGTFQGYTTNPINYDKFTEIFNSFIGQCIVSQSLEYYNTYKPKCENVINLDVVERMDHSAQKNKKRNEVILF
jgi:DNA adenine methylase